MASIPSPIVNSGVRKTLAGQKVSSRTVTLKERPSTTDRSTVWVRNDNPDVLVFTDDAGTDWVLNSAAPDLTAVLTAGDDGGGLDVTNIGGLTFDTATNTKGIAIGTDLGVATTSLESHIAIGYQSDAGSGAGNVAIGSQAYITSNGTKYNTVIGYNTAINGVGDYNVVVGCSSQVFASSYGIAIGNSASSVLNTSGIAIGRYAGIKAGADYGIAIGTNAYVNTLDSIAIGHVSYIDSYSEKATAVGVFAKVYTSNYGVAIGYKSYVNHTGSIVIGNNMGSSTTDEVTLGTTLKHIRIPFTLDATAPPGGGTVALPNATTMLDVTINGVAYQIPLFAP